MFQLVQVSPEAKERAIEAKLRGDDAFRRKEYLTAVNDYTQVCLWDLEFLFCHFSCSLTRTFGPYAWFAFSSNM